MSSRERSWVGFIAVLSGLVGGLLTGCEQQEPIRSGVPETKHLTVLTPHSEPIRQAFGTGFWHWHLEKYGQPAEITWVYRGTPQCVEYVRLGYERDQEGVRHKQPDVMFGGGVTDHAMLAADELSRAIDLGADFVGVPAEVNGIRTRDKQGYWYATGLSSFGLLVNAEACQVRGIVAPTTWTDLAEPRFFGWLAVADPMASGSHRECLMLTLQSQGWNAGWATIVRILGNTRALNQRSGDALKQVQTGTALATFCVNFDGMSVAAGSEGALRYVDPPGATTVTPDVISVLEGTEAPALAEKFVQYVLSEEGQALWGVQRDHRAPYGPTLYHYPIRPELYTDHAGLLAVERNPLKEDFGLRVEAATAAGQGNLLKALVAAACQGENHVRLQQAWSGLIAAGMPADVLATFTQPVIDEAEMNELVGELATADRERLAELADSWAPLFSEKFIAVSSQLGS